MLFGIFFRRKQQRRRAINHARRRARMVHRFNGEIWIFLVDQLPECRAISLRRHIGKHRKGGLQFGQTFDRGFGTRIFLMVKNDAAIVVVEFNRKSMGPNSSICRVDRKYESSLIVTAILNEAIEVPPKPIVFTSLI